MPSQRIRPAEVLLAAAIRQLSPRVGTSRVTAGPAITFLHLLRKRNLIKTIFQDGS